MRKKAQQLFCAEKTRLKIPCHTKNKENHSLNERRQSTDSRTEMKRILGSSDKDFKAAIIKVFQQVTVNSLEKKLKYFVNKETNDITKLYGNYRTILQV